MRCSNRDDPRTVQEMASADAIRVAIIEDDRPIREGLGVLIDGTPGYACVGQFSSIEEALTSIASVEPHVILLDINLPGQSGTEGVRPIRATCPSSEILMLTVYAEQDKVFQSICNGAGGYLLKKTSPARLLEAIREAREGGAPMSPEIARKVVALFRQTRAPRQPEHQLTPHEVRLLALLAEGYSYQAIGERLHVSVNTVRNYIRSIYDKLHVHSKSEAVSKALRHRLID